MGSMWQRTADTVVPVERGGRAPTLWPLHRVVPPLGDLHLRVVAPGGATASHYCTVLRHALYCTALHVLHVLHVLYCTALRHALYCTALHVLRPAGSREPWHRTHRTQWQWHRLGLRHHSPSPGCRPWRPSCAASCRARRSRTRAWGRHMVKVRWLCSLTAVATLALESEHSLAPQPSRSLPSDLQWGMVRGEALYAACAMPSGRSSREHPGPLCNQLLGPLHRGPCQRPPCLTHRGTRHRGPRVHGPHAGLPSTGGSRRGDLY